MTNTFFIFFKIILDYSKNIYIFVKNNIKLFLGILYGESNSLFDRLIYIYRD